MEEMGNDDLRLLWSLPVLRQSATRNSRAFTINFVHHEIIHFTVQLAISPRMRCSSIHATTIGNVLVVRFTYLLRRGDVCLLATPQFSSPLEPLLKGDCMASVAAFA